MLTGKNLEKILNSWNERAEDDDVAFYKEHWEKKLKDGKKCFVIGRKGSGKTALCNHINSGVQRSTIVTFENFNANYLKQISELKSGPGQAALGKNLWKLLIYSQVYLMIVQNKDTHSVYEDEEIAAIIGELYPHITTKSCVPISSFNIQALGAGVGFKIREKKGVSVDQAIKKLDDFLSVNLLDNPHNTLVYHVLFDKLDAEFIFREGDDERDTYFALLSDLFDTILAVRRHFASTIGPRIHCIAFLRDDLYDELRNPLKATWENELVRIAWHKDELKEILAYRLGVVLNMQKTPFDDIWSTVVHPASKTQADKLFSKILFQTQLRPRDFVLYIKIMAEKMYYEVKNSDAKQIAVTERIINNASREYSHRLRDHIIDEYLPHFDKLEEAIGLLDCCESKAFDYSSAERAFGTFCRQNHLTVSDLLEKLYNCNVIGILSINPSHGIRYKYSNDSHFYRGIDVEYRIHEGLVKAVFQKGVR